MSDLNTEKKHPTTKTYLAVFTWLIVLTVVEVIGAQFDLPRHIIAIFLIATAVLKSLLIIFYFMHMRYEKFLVWLIPIYTLLLAFYFIFMIFPDIVYHLPNQYK